MKVRIEIDTKTFVRFWLVVIGFALAGLALYSARTALIIIGTAFFLALALNGPVSWLAKYLPGNSRAFSTAISFIVVVAALGAVVFLVVPPIIQQTAKFAANIPEFVDTATQRWNGINDIIDKYQIRPQFDQTLESIKSSAGEWATNAGGNIASSISSLFSFTAAAILVLVLSFLMLVEGPAWMKRIWALYRDKATMKYHQRIVHRMHHVVSGYVTGQLSVSALDGFFAGIAVLILGVIFGVPLNLAIPSAAIAFLFSLIPMFGATIGGVIVFLLLVFNSLGAGIAYAVFFVIYQQIENNLIAPAIQSKRIDLSALAVLGSVTIGLYLFGVAGGIISIPIAGCVKVLVEEYLEKAKHERDASSKPLHKLTKKIKDVEV